MAEQLPIWQESGVEPPALLKTNGWQPGMKPSAQHMNWLFNRIYKCIEEIQVGGGTEELEQELANLQLAFEEHLTAKATVNEVGHVQLSNLINGISSTKAATEKAVSDAIKNVQIWGQNAIAHDLAVDPNVATDSYILTNHSNSPGQNLYWHIQTYFFANKTGNKAQIAIAYNGTTSQIQTRHLYGTTWTPWRAFVYGDMVNVPWGIAGLDGTGKLSPSAFPSTVDAFKLLYDIDFSTYPLPSLEVANLSTYKKLRLIGKQIRSSDATTRNLQIWLDNVNVNSGTFYSGTQLVNGTVGGASHLIPSLTIGGTTGGGGLAEFIVDIDVETNVAPRYRANSQVFNYLGNTQGAYQVFGTFNRGGSNPMPINTINLLLQNSVGVERMTSGKFEVWGVLR